MIAELEAERLRIAEEAALAGQAAALECRKQAFAGTWKRNLLRLGAYFWYVYSAF